MKNLILAILLLATTTLAAQTQQSGKVQPVPGMFYELQVDATGYYHLADTVSSANSVEPGMGPVSLSKGAQVLVTGKLGTRWRRFFYQGYDYFIATNSLKSTKDQAGSRSAGSSDYAERRGGSEGRAIRTGPRGGRYYINSNGNKTYIRH